MLDLSKIKLIVWDLDDTFWSGTLSEGSATWNMPHCDFIRALTDKGIINSICSKNNFQDVEAFFNKNHPELFDLFVFKSINWEPKGTRVKNIIENAALRPVNVLFIDDNESNLNEVKFYNPDINICLPSEINNLIKQLPNTGKDDTQHSRLNQYKILERKVADKNQTASNDDFLRNSDICVQIHKNCIQQIDRLHELLIRSNQLNYTKNRCSKDELIALLRKKNISAGYITCFDKYGDYGIVGFFALDKQKHELVHFLFSCRTLGMGVEQYVYAKLHFPKLTTIGEVANHVQPQKYISYISDKKQHKRKITSKTNLNVLLKGPCDLSGIMPYLSGNMGIDTEFVHANEDRPTTVCQQHSVCTVDAKRMPQSDIDKILKRIPMLSSEDYTTALYDTKYDVIVFSLLIDDLLGLYKDKQTGLVFPFGNYQIPITDKEFEAVWTQTPVYANEFGLTPEKLAYFRKNLEFMGPITCQHLTENLTYIRNNINPNTKLILILGSEFEPISEPQDSQGLYLRHREMNKSVLNWAKTQQNVECINLTDFIKTPEDYRDMVNHFQRHIYYKLAQRLAASISSNIKVHDNNFWKNITIDKHKRIVCENGTQYRYEQLFLHLFGANIPLSKKRKKVIK